MGRAFTASIRSDQIGKVFRVLARDVRQCLICAKLFTSQGDAAHAETACLPSQSSFALVGKTNDANR
jgi:hypothetical protein